MAGAPVRALLLALAGLCALLAVACLDRPAGRPDRGDAPGAEIVSFRTADGVTLSGRLWARDPRRLVIYLHEYRGTQATWWPTARDGAPADPSALTFDFRGHGTSEGDEDDVAGIVPDAVAALALARDRGYERVVFVGAGMGGAAAIVVAAQHEHVAVLGLSAPSEFADVLAHEAVPPLAGRIALMAADGDLSAAESVEVFQKRATIPSTRVVMLRGIDHGEALLTGERHVEATAAFRRLLDELWGA